jgi:hypothetical protein
MVNEELKELQDEGELIRNELDNIAFINGMEGDELDEFWTTITKLVDNGVELEGLSNALKLGYS